MRQKISIATLLGASLFCLSVVALAGGQQEATRSSVAMKSEVEAPPDGSGAREMIAEPEAGDAIKQNVVTQASGDGETAKRRALTLFKRVRPVLDSGDVQGAYLLLLDIWRLDPNFEMAANLGVVELQLGKYAAAASHLDYALEHVPASQLEYYEEAFAPSLVQAERHVGKVTMSIYPADADVRLGQGPVLSPLFLAPGNHELNIRRPGYYKETVTVRSVAGQAQVLSVRLRSLPVSPPVAETVPVAPPPRRPKAVSRPRPLVWWIGGVTTGALALGALWLDRLAVSKRKSADAGSFDECNSEQPFNSQCAGYRDTRKTLDGQRFWSHALGVGSGVAFLGTLVTAFVWTEEVPLVASITPSEALIEVKYVF